MIDVVVGWHNFHHAFPMDFRCSDIWWQWNPTKWSIQALSLLGFTHNLRIHKRRGDDADDEN
jgi:stearoyl-CoA desaturase (delta-9 desaturase)